MKILIFILLLGALTVSGQAIKYPFSDDGTELGLGRAVKLTAAGLITACGDNDSDVVGLIIAKSLVTGTRYYLLISSDLAYSPLPNTAVVKDRLTTAASGGLRTATSGEVIVGTACANGDGNDATLEKVMLSIDYPVKAMDYTEAWRDWTLAVAGVWQDVSLVAYGVPANAVCEIAIVNIDLANEWQGGVRANGSVLPRMFDLHEAEGSGGGSQGMDIVSMQVKADESSVVECYAENRFNVVFYLVGWWSTRYGVSKFSPAAASLKP